MNKYLSKLWKKTILYVKFYLFLAKFHIHTFFATLETGIHAFISSITRSNTIFGCDDKQKFWHKQENMERKQEAIRLEVDRRLNMMDLIHALSLFKLNLILYAGCKSGEIKDTLVEDAETKFQEQRVATKILFGKLYWRKIEIPAELESAITDEALLLKITDLKQAKSYCKYLDDLANPIYETNSSSRPAP